MQGFKFSKAIIDRVNFLTLLENQRYNSVNNRFSAITGNRKY